MKYKIAAVRSILAALFLVAAAFSGCRNGNPVESTGTTAAASQREILQELNYARTNPREYARQLESIRQYFRGNVLQIPGQAGIRTQEGVKAVDEAIRYLHSVAAVGPLSYSSGLEKAAADHVRDTGPKGIASHTGSDGSSPRERVERYGRWQTAMAENIAFCPATSARRIVIQLIVDDGVADRGHRDAIFNPDYRLVGIATGSHAVYGSMCVQEFAGGFRAFSTTAGDAL